MSNRSNCCRSEHTLLPQYQAFIPIDLPPSDMPLYFGSDGRVFRPSRGSTTSRTTCWRKDTHYPDRKLLCWSF